MLSMKPALPIFLIIFASQSLSAVELSYGKGSFGMKAGIGSLFSSDIDLDINTWSLTEQHQNIKKGRFYYQYQFDYFNSNAIDKISDFASSPASSNVPVFGSSPDDIVNDFTQAPVPADYRIRGINFDIGLGYDFVKLEKTMLGFSVNTGLSTPFMRIRNMENTSNLVIELLDNFDTKVKTYKLGASLHGEYAITERLSLIGRGSLNFQTGKMRNDTLKSDVTVDGVYQSFHLGLKYHPKFIQRVFFAGGYDYNRWDYGSTTLDTPIGQAEIAQNIDIVFDSSNFHIGLGYSF
jgi:hypothetical protein